MKVSPEAHSTPNIATMSPALALSMSTMSAADMRTRRGTLIFFWLAEQLMMKSRRRAGEGEPRRPNAR